MWGRLLRVISLLSVTAAALGITYGGTSGAENSWKIYVGATGSKIQYPSGWTVMENDKYGLSILSDSRRATATIISDGESAITVNEVKIPADGDFLKYSEKRGDGIFEHKFIEIPDASVNSCKNFEEIGRYLEYEPPDRQMITDLYCLVNGRSFDVSLINWEANGRKNEFLDIAERMIRSLTVE